MVCTWILIRSLRYQVQKDLDLARVMLQTSSERYKTTDVKTLRDASDFHRQYRGMVSSFGLFGEHDSARYCVCIVGMCMLSTRDLSICCSRDSRDNVDRTTLWGWVDAYWAGDTTTRPSSLHTDTAKEPALSQRSHRSQTTYRSTVPSNQTSRSYEGTMPEDSGVSPSDEPNLNLAIRLDWSEVTKLSE